jgi:hypothetical protein
MTDPVPSKDQLEHATKCFTEANRCFSDGVCDCGNCEAGRALIAEIENLRRENVRWENAHRILLSEIERLRKERVPNVCCGDYDNCRQQCIPLVDELRRRAAPEPDAVEAAARARFIEVHGLPAHDPWECAPSATKKQYREWARRNAQPPGDGQ